jgi:hypothetical protein
MYSFEACLEQFDQHGDKTNWTYVTIPQEVAGQMHPEDRKTFRIKGFIDAVPVTQVAVQPIKNGGYLLALNSTLRRKLRKTVGQTVTLRLQKDVAVPELPEAFLAALQSDGDALARWEQLPPSHQRYFSNHVASAKTPETQLNRIVQSVIALALQQSFGEMIRAQKAIRNTTG